MHGKFAHACVCLYMIKGVFYMLLYAFFYVLVQV